MSLTDVKVVEKVLDTTFDGPSFQVAHGDLTLYIIANDDVEQDDWVQLIRQCKRKKNGDCMVCPPWN